MIGGMVLLLALCGWAVGGEEGARWAVTGGAPGGAGPLLSPEEMRRRFGARLLRPADAPALFHLLGALCRRAGLPRHPDLYWLADVGSMNAYALGGPAASAIVLTEGLLRGMTPAEVAGIIAHEISHIRNNDGWAMSLAAALHRATAVTSLLGLACLRGREGRPGEASRALAALLSGAPAIGQLLHLALSRIREFDADAAAVELLDDPQGLVAALHKLECHHLGRPPMASTEEGLLRFLRSHPATWERVGTLLRFGGGPVGG